MIPFTKTADYYARLKAVNDMMLEGLLLPEDAFAEFTRGLVSAQTDYSLKNEQTDE